MFYGCCQHLSLARCWHIYILCSYSIWVEFSRYSFVVLLCLIILGIMWPRVQESLPSMFSKQILSNYAHCPSLSIYSHIFCISKHITYIYFVQLSAGILLLPCHLLLRSLSSFMLVWMPWTLKNGSLLVIGMSYVIFCTGD
jgi:hypothetical protein